MVEKNTEVIEEDKIIEMNIKTLVKNKEEKYINLDKIITLLQKEITVNITTSHK